MDLAEVSSDRMKNRYFVYILTNAGGTVLYVGVTNDLCGRVDEHASGVGCAFTKKYRVHQLLYFEEYGEVRQAIAREKEIKGWRRRKKEALVRSMNPTLENLRPDLHPMQT